AEVGIGRIAGSIATCTGEVLRLYSCSSRISISPLDMQDQITAAYSGASGTYQADESFRQRAWVSSLEEYRRLYQRSIDDPESFWREQAKRLTWFRDFDKVRDVSYDPSNLYIRWFTGGKLNACYNCVDRHLEERGDRLAFIFEPDDPSDSPQHITYRDLYDNVVRFANVLLKHGVKRGDRVTIYLPMIPEAVYAMLACA